MYIKDEYNVDQSHLIEMGIEFYVAGRICCCRNFMGTYLILPILFHHAMEYLIKAYLNYDTSAKELKNTFNHNLIKLWNAFKEKEKDKNLNKYDNFIEQFDKAKMLRYPEGNNVDVFEDNNPTFYFGNNVDNFEPNSVGWSLEMIDEIIYLICKRMRAPLSPIDWIVCKFRKCEELFEGNKFFTINTQGIPTN